MIIKQGVLAVIPIIFVISVARRPRNIIDQRMRVVECGLKVIRFLQSWNARNAV